MRGTDAPVLEPLDLMASLAALYPIRDAASVQLL